MQMNEWRRHVLPQQRPLLAGSPCIQRVYLAGLVFCSLRHGWVHARKLLVAILLVGLVYGTTRVLQGWHYMSHTFWAGIFVWFSTWVTALLFYGRSALQAPEHNPAMPEAALPQAM